MDVLPQGSVTDHFSISYCEGFLFTAVFEHQNGRIRHAVSEGPKNQQKSNKTIKHNQDNHQKISNTIHNKQQQQQKQIQD